MRAVDAEVRLEAIGAGAGGHCIILCLGEPDGLSGDVAGLVLFVHVSWTVRGRCGSKGVPLCVIGRVESLRLRVERVCTSPCVLRVVDSAIACSLNDFFKHFLR